MRLTIMTHSIRGRRMAWLPDSPITHAGVSGVASSRATTASTPNLLLYGETYTGRKIPHHHRFNLFLGFQLFSFQLFIRHDAIIQGFLIDKNLTRNELERHIVNKILKLHFLNAHYSCYYIAQVTLVHK